MRKSLRGFTLVELLITVTVMAVVLAIAAPSFKQQLISSRTSAAAEQFSTALNFARSQAVRTVKRVSVCASSNGTSCTGNWSDGFIVFEDKATSDTASSIDLGNPVVIYKVWPKLESPGTFTIRRGSNDVSFIRFTALGTLAATSSDPVAATLKLTGCSGKSAKNISVSLSGMVSVREIDCQEE